MEESGALVPCFAPKYLWKSVHSNYSDGFKSVLLDDFISFKSLILDDVIVFRIIEDLPFPLRLSQPWR
jgi:hypothetical protein